MTVKHTPPLAAWLGYGGLIPFVTLALAATLGGPYADMGDRALRDYAAVILSFVGALHWGFATMSRDIAPGARNRAFAWSVIPSLLAWAALLLPPTASSLLLTAGFALHFLMDRRFVKQTPVAAWYLPLRFRLTLIACLCLILGAWPGTGRHAAGRQSVASLFTSLSTTSIISHGVLANVQRN
jgi:hypothetical protein